MQSRDKGVTLLQNTAHKRPRTTKQTQRQRIAVLESRNRNTNSLNPNSTAATFINLPVNEMQLVIK